MFWKFDTEGNEVVQQPNEFISSNEAGAEDRFHKRTDLFKQENKPLYKHHVWWLIHNCVAHPLIGIIPNKWTFDFHDWTSTKINGK